MKRNLVWLLILLSLLALLGGCTQADPGFAVVQTSAGVEILVDDTSDAVVTLDFVHHEIHEGDTYTYTDVVDLANNNVRDIQITTPNTAVRGHIVFELNSESEVEWFLYENVIINVPGVAVAELNSDRNSANTADLVVAAIDNNTVVLADADTAVAGATTIYHVLMGAGKDSGTYDHEHEIILKQNEDYSLRIIANAAGYVSYHVDWYEHTP